MRDSATYPVLEAAPPARPDAGALLRRKVERATGILGQFTACFTDQRDGTRVEHPWRRSSARGSTPWR